MDRREGTSSSDSAGLDSICSEQFFPLDCHLQPPVIGSEYATRRVCIDFTRPTNAIAQMVQTEAELQKQMN